MKWVAALLLIANVALYLWAGGGNAGGEQNGNPKPDVNREGMLLLSEIQPQAAGAATTGLSRADSACYRIGPLKEQAGWASAKLWMSAQKFPYKTVRNASREMRAIRVFLGPFDSAAAAQPAMASLTEKEIDHFVDPEAGEQGAVRVSLGYFTQEELAVKFIAHLLARGIEANSRTEYRAMGPFHWMEASIDTPRRDRLLSRRWPEKGVVAREIDCSAIAVQSGTDG